MVSARQKQSRDKADKRRRQLAYAEEYLKECLPIVRLDLWDFSVSDGGADETSFMTIETAPSHFEANLSIYEAFWDEPAEDKPKIVAHELVHPHTSRILDAVEDAFKPLVVPAYWDSLIAQVKSIEELAADELGRSLVEMFPKWSPPKGAE